MENTFDYMDEYSAFEKKFHLTQVSGEEIGELIMRLANYFARYNIKLSEALKAFSKVKADYQNQIEMPSGKPMSSAKAETLADATPEAAAYETARIHINNLEQYINALKSLQRGVLQEYSHQV